MEFNSFPDTTFVSPGGREKARMRAGTSKLFLCSKLAAFPKSSLLYAVMRILILIRLANHIPMFLREQILAVIH